MFFASRARALTSLRSSGAGFSAAALARKVRPLSISAPPPPPPSYKVKHFWKEIGIGGTAAAFVSFVAVTLSSLDNPVDGDVLNDRKITDVVYFDLCNKTDDDTNLWRVVIGLFGEDQPRTVENFCCLCSGERGEGLHYLGTPITRIVPRFMLQGGDVEKKDGTGTKSIYGRHFLDESFDLKHEGPFVLSMANRGPNTNGSQFFITTAKAPQLDGRHCVFGKVLEGFDVVRSVEACGCKAGTPRKEWVIAGCGIVRRGGSVTNAADNANTPAVEETKTPAEETKKPAVEEGASAALDVKEEVLLMRLEAVERAKAAHVASLASLATRVAFVEKDLGMA